MNQILTGKTRIEIEREILVGNDAKPIGDLMLTIGDGVAKIVWPHEGEAPFPDPPEGTHYRVEVERETVESLPVTTARLRTVPNAPPPAPKHAVAIGLTRGDIVAATDACGLLGVFWGRAMESEDPDRVQHARLMAKAVDVLRKGLKEIG